MVMLVSEEKMIKPESFDEKLRRAENLGKTFRDGFCFRARRLGVGDLTNEQYEQLKRAYDGSRTHAAKK